MLRCAAPGTRVFSLRYTLIIRPDTWLRLDPGQGVFPHTLETPGTPGIPQHWLAFTFQGNLYSCTELCRTTSSSDRSVCARHDQEHRRRHLRSRKLRRRDAAPEGLRLASLASLCRIQKGFCPPVLVARSSSSGSNHGQDSLCRTHQTPQHVFSPALSGRLVPTTPRGPPNHRRSDGRRPALTSG